MIALLALASSGARVGDSPLDRIARLARRDTIRVLVTDSGLGGLSVCADIEARARTAGGYRVLHLVFANALPEGNKGYNKMRSVEQKVRVFDAALHGMERWYAPDVILVACNTLSVLIPQTRFAAENRIPMLGIVETGVQMILERLQADTNSSAIVFGTETTIAAGTHQALLEKSGIRPGRIVTQACPNLAGEIESDAGSDVVGTAIDMFAADAGGRVKAQHSRIIAGLCCTHYGYVRDRFAEALRAVADGPVEVVNPNDRMSDVLFPPGKASPAGIPQITVQVVSRAVITPEEVASIGGLLAGVSPATAAALRTYELKRDLFPYTEE
jgi:glutamate racemase